MSRRTFAGLAAGLACTPVIASNASIAALPTEIAGIAVPDSRLAHLAASLSRSASPDFLFNHCMRTYLFGALFARKAAIVFDPEPAFIAAVFHDFGLLPRYESSKQSFEIDGANAAEKFASQNGSPRRFADVVWHAVELHDGKWDLTRRQGGEAMVVAVGAGADVVGPDPDVISPHERDEVVAAYPRLGFKARFTALLTEHCKRKPLSQRGTWLEGLCREQVPEAWTDTVEKEIATAPFAE